MGYITFTDVTFSAVGSSLFAVVVLSSAGVGRLLHCRRLGFNQRRIRHLLSPPCVFRIIASAAAWSPDQRQY